MEVLPYFIFIIGLIFLVKGADWLISGSSFLGRRLGISDLAIGMTVVAFGTSLPELIVSVLAAARGHADVAVGYDIAAGNVVGSNIFNIFLILGISATIKPLPLNAQVNTDLGVLVGSTLVLFLCMFTGKRRIIDRWEGVLMMFGYVGYIAFLIGRE